MLSLLSNLPKDLPEAFERALEEIIDDQYGDSVMKLVMAAPSPLSLDELRVALAVVPGDPIWHAAKLPADTSQLISLCGGNLLEVDEEDGRVRFIHYSVVSHLLQTTKNPRTMMYHFTSRDAEIQSGAICVTFLNMPIFETAVSMTRKVDGDSLAKEVIGAATHDQPLLSRLAHLLKKTDRRQSKSIDFDIGPLLAEIQAARMFKFDPHCFQDYAISNWLPHSRAFQKENPLCLKIWHLWVRLLCGNIQVAKPPFQSPTEEAWPALSWALKDHHKVLIYAIFEEPTTEPTERESLSEGIVELASSFPAALCDGSTLGLMLVHLFQLAANVLIAGPRLDGDLGIVKHTNDSVSKMPWRLLYPSLQQLLELGADPTTPHSRNGNNLLQMLLATLGCISETTLDGVQLFNLLTRVLACDNAPSFLRSSWVPHALRGILEYDNTLVFAALLSYLPELRLEHGENSLIGVAVAKGNIDIVKALIQAWRESGLGPVPASYINGQPAILLALEMQNKEMVQLLASRPGSNHYLGEPTFSTRLLKIAVERLSVEWVELLLQLGADPNLSYRALIEEPFSRTEFRYHIQIAAENSQTLKFLTLIRYGADPFVPTNPTISNILRRRNNRVLMARLEELDFFQPTKRSHPLDVGLLERPPPPSALLEACKMLALGVNEAETLRHFGVAQSQHADSQAKGQEVKLILLDLVRTTRPDRLSLQCQEGNTTLHYLTGGMDRFHHEALGVASHLVATEGMRWFLRRNKLDQTPMHRAIENGSRNRWRPPYIESISFILSYLPRDQFSLRSILRGEDSILGFAILRGAPVDPVIKALLGAGSDPNGTLQGATLLEIAVNMPAFDYASKVTACLLSRGADPYVNRSNRGSLLDVVTTERRDWLQYLLELPWPDQASLWNTLHWKLNFDVSEPTTEGSLKNELEDTRARRLSFDEPQRSRPLVPGWQARSRDSSRASSDISTRAIYDDGEIRFRAAEQRI